MKLVSMLMKFVKSLKAPWTFVVVAMATIVACYLMIHTGLNIPGAAYSLAAILVGGLVAKSLIAVTIGAMKTMLLMITCASILVVVAVTYTDASIFKDSAVLGLLNMFGGGVVILIGELLGRRQA